jgi:hypothetical protein
LLLSRQLLWPILSRFSAASWSRPPASAGDDDLRRDDDEDDDDDRALPLHRSPGSISAALQLQAACRLFIALRVQL